MEEMPYEVEFSSIPQIFIKASLHNSFRCRFGRYSCDDNRQNPCPHGAYIWQGSVGEANKNIIKMFYIMVESDKYYEKI